MPHLPENDNAPHALYRLWSSTGKLLYVGISLTPYLRMKQHSADKSWWGDVASVTFQTFDSRGEVLEAESEAILNERPLHNIRGRLSRSNKEKHLPPPSAPEAEKRRLCWMAVLNSAETHPLMQLREGSPESQKVEYMNADEAADFLRVHPVTLGRWRAAGTGPTFVRVGRSIRYSATELQAWLAHRAA